MEFLIAELLVSLGDAREVSRSLLTAAGIWKTSAIGVCAALGRFGTALSATVLAWCVLSVLNRLEQHLEEAPSSESSPRRAAAGYRKARMARETRKEAIMGETPRNTEPSTDVSERKPNVPHVEDLIDESVEESFPASDPPAVSPKKDPVGSPPPAKDRPPDGRP